MLIRVEDTNDNSPIFTSLPTEAVAVKVDRSICIILDSLKIDSLKSLGEGEPGAGQGGHLQGQRQGQWRFWPGQNL